MAEVEAEAVASDLPPEAPPLVEEVVIHLGDSVAQSRRLLAFGHHMALCANIHDTM